MRIGREEVQNLQDAVEILLSIETPPQNKDDIENHLWLPIKGKFTAIITKKFMFNMEM